jgi:hypothetical protein
MRCRVVPFYEQPPGETPFGDASRVVLAASKHIVGTCSARRWSLLRYHFSCLAPFGGYCSEGSPGFPRRSASERRSVFTPRPPGEKCPFPWRESPPIAPLYLVERAPLYIVEWAMGGKRSAPSEPRSALRRAKLHCWCLHLSACSATTSLIAPKARPASHSVPSAEQGMHPGEGYSFAGTLLH